MRRHSWKPPSCGCPPKPKGPKQASSYPVAERPSSAGPVSTGCECLWRLRLGKGPTALRRPLSGLCRRQIQKDWRQGRLEPWSRAAGEGDVITRHCPLEVCVRTLCGRGARRLRIFPTCKRGRGMRKWASRHTREVGNSSGRARPDKLASLEDRGYVPQVAYVIERILGRYQDVCLLAR
jgi:hypothetical protein